MPKKIIITFDGDEYRVPGPDGREATAYYTNDKDDAIRTACVMWNRISQPYPAADFRVKKVEQHPEGTKGRAPKAVKPVKVKSQKIKIFILTFACTEDAADDASAILSASYSFAAAEAKMREHFEEEFNTPADPESPTHLERCTYGGAPTNEWSVSAGSYFYKIEETELA